LHDDLKKQMLRLRSERQPVVCGDSFNNPDVATDLGLDGTSFNAAVIIAKEGMDVQRILACSGGRWQVQRLTERL